MKTVVVIGGGITGLSAMHYIQKLKKEKNLDLDLLLIEKEEQLGGKIRTVKDKGFIMETGADSIVARNESVMPLIEELQLEDRLVYNATGISYLYTNNKLHAIPADTIFGIPMSKEALFSSTLVSEQGKKEALKDFDTPNDRFTRDSSIGEFLEAFLGKELVNNQIAPVLSGVYSGDLYDLTLASTLPYLVDYKNEYGSIIKGLEANKKRFQGASNKKFISFDEGMGVLIDRLEEKLEDTTILKGVGTTGLTKTNGQYEIHLDNGETMKADYVILAVPHNTAQEILQQPALDNDFSSFKNSTLISVYLGFSLPDAQLPADGTGFIVSENNDILCNACTWTSRKWTHTSQAQNLLVRLFYKSSNPSYEKLKDLPQEQLVEAALGDIRKSLNIQAKPETVEVTDWKNLMPNYHMGHKASVDALEGKMDEIVPDVFLAGASYYGVGIGACIQNGKDIAMRIEKKL
ncbi:protoporphyrinogen oxidase [Planococcus salinus]|uniref:Coproporphyrinogen III oxidase n=1 Tax=Planococcus salinus TaxID=1848460 RepID=A0A3M8P4T8_9BACL|nr:protoporphyrinogen oxidase [Planococcus salinus]RNF38677.1 protoporphyrinogen oxidase [Planococcus salinus]